jgi:hypothetical protein
MSPKLVCTLELYGHVGPPAQEAALGEAIWLEREDGLVICEKRRDRVSPNSARQLAGEYSTGDSPETI